MSTLRTRYRSALWVVAALVSSAAGADAAGPAVAPVPVSPVALAGVATVESRCPTFLWGAVERAERYELRVYDAALDDAAEADGEGEPALARELPGSVGGWVPVSDECFERGGRYAWTVRALVAGGVSEWSQPSVFEIAAELSAREARELLRLLRRAADEGVPGEIAAAGDIGGLAPSAGVLAADRPWPSRGRQEGKLGASSGPAAAAEERELWVTLPAAAFQVVEGTGVYQLADGSWRCGSVLCELAAPLDVPHGSTIVGIELEACDLDPSDSGSVSALVVDAPPFGLPITTSHGQANTLGPEVGCRYSLAAAVRYVADQYLHSHSVYVYLNPSVGSQYTVTFTAVRVYYEPNGEGVVEPTALTPASLFP